MKILIVEDEFMPAYSLALTLQSAGHQLVGPAASADEAMLFAQANPPELAFVDIKLEGERDGIDVARALANEHGTTCVFLTEQVERARLAQGAATGVITKPYDPRDLLRSVDIIAAICQGALPSAAPARLELFR